MCLLLSKVTQTHGNSGYYKKKIGRQTAMSMSLSSRRRRRRRRHRCCCCRFFPPRYRRRHRLVSA